ncbi:MAG TPA: hypothetical protein VFQ75_10220 [Candidatus Limnocylindrales bacterium]|nr:hypothetical protein [Candidatus Limnocylindrales bacterium]
MLTWYTVRALLATAWWLALVAAAVLAVTTAVRLAAGIVADPGMLLLAPLALWLVLLVPALVLNPLLLPATAWHRVRLRRYEEATAQRTGDFTPVTSAGVKVETTWGLRSWPWGSVRELGEVRRMNPDDIRHLPTRKAGPTTPTRPLPRYEALLARLRPGLWLTVVITGVLAGAALVVHLIVQAVG